MCDEMTKTFDAHPEHHDDDRCMIFIEDDNKAGIVIHGYEDNAEAMAALFVHLQAIFKVSGKRLEIIWVDVPDDPSGLFN